MSFEEFQEGCHGCHLGYRNGTILAIPNLYNATMPPMLPSRFSSIWHMVWEKISFEEFQHGSRGSHLGYRNGRISVSLWCLPSSFGSIRLKVWEEIKFEEFQDGHHRGGHLGYWNRTILAILNLYVAPMPPIKFRLNLTYGLGGDVVWRISRWPPRWPSWILEKNNFSNSESLCHCDASHQVLAQSD